MTLNLNDEERDFLLELLESRRTSMMHELHHTDTHDYKKILSKKLELLEELQKKVNQSQTG